MSIHDDIRAQIRQRIAELEALIPRAAAGVVASLRYHDRRGAADGRATAAKLQADLAAELAILDAVAVDEALEPERAARAAAEKEAERAITAKRFAAAATQTMSDIHAAMPTKGSE